MISDRVDHLNFLEEEKNFVKKIYKHQVLIYEILATIVKLIVNHQKLCMMKFQQYETSTKSMLELFFKKLYQKFYRFLNKKKYFYVLNF